MTAVRPPQRTGRRKTVRPVIVIAVGITVIAVITVLAYGMLGAANGPGFLGYKTIYATVPDTGNLAPRDSVSVYGVRVGQVLSLKRVGDATRIEIRLSPGARRVPADSTVVLRGAGLLGQLYVQIVPGRSPDLLPYGGTLKPAADSLTSNVPDVLNTFDPKTRVGLQHALDGLGEGVAGRGIQLNNMLHLAPTTAQEFTTLAATLINGRAVPALVPALDRGTAALDSARGAISQVLSSGVAAQQPFYNQRGALEDTLSDAPSALQATTRGLPSGDRILDAARELADAANSTLPAAPAGLSAVSDLLTTSHVPLRRATALLRSAIPAVPAASQLVQAVRPVLTPVRTLINNAVQPVVTLGQHGCDLINFASNWRSTLGQGQPAADGGAELPSGRIGSLDVFRITLVLGTDALEGAGAPVAPSTIGTQDTYPTACKYTPGKTYPQG